MYISFLCCDLCSPCWVQDALWTDSGCRVLSQQWMCLCFSHAAPMKHTGALRELSTLNWLSKILLPLSYLFWLWLAILPHIFLSNWQRTFFFSYHQPLKTNSVTMKMRALRFSETSEHLTTTRCRNPKAGNCCGILKTHKRKARLAQLFCHSAM